MLLDELALTGLTLTAPPPRLERSVASCAEIGAELAPNLAEAHSEPEPLRVRSVQRRRFAGHSYEQVTFDHDPQLPEALSREGFGGPATAVVHLCRDDDTRRRCSPVYLARLRERLLGDASLDELALVVDLLDAGSERARGRDVARPQEVERDRGIAETTRRVQARCDAERDVRRAHRSLDLRRLAERAIVVDLGAVPFGRSAMREWLRRVADVSGHPGLDSRTFLAELAAPPCAWPIRPLARGYAALGADDLGALAARYGARYVVRDDPVPLPWPALHREGRVTLYAVPGA